MYNAEGAAETSAAPLIFLLSVFLPFSPVLQAMNEFIVSDTQFVQMLVQHPP